MNILALRNMQFKVPLGYYEEERRIGSKVEIDVFMQLVKKDDYVDEIGETINYEEVYSLVNEEISKEWKLIEAAASGILKTLEFRFSERAQFEVILRKLRPPLGGVVECAEIRMASQDFNQNN